MRGKTEILVFIMAFAVSWAVVSRQSIVEWLWPSFTRDEVAARVGHRIHYRHTDEFRGIKCPDDGGVCKVVADGERGTIVALEPVSYGRYFLKISWDEPHADEPYVSFCGRYTCKVIIEE